MRISLLLLTLCLSVAAAELEIQALKAAGAEIKNDKDGQPRDIFFRNSSAITVAQWKQIGTLTTLRKGTFYNKTTLTDESLPLLRELQNLEEFAVDGAHLTDTGMAGFKTWKNLRKITFFHVFWGAKNFNGTGLSAFAELPRLEAFAMGGSTLTDAGLDGLAKLTQLKELNLWHTDITDAGIAKLKALAKLTRLRLAPQFNGKLSDAMVAHVLDFSALEKLSFGETRLSYAALKALQALPKLKELELERIDIAEAELAKLRADLAHVLIKHTRPDEKELERLNRVSKK